MSADMARNVAIVLLQVHILSFALAGEKDVFYLKTQVSVKIYTTVSMCCIDRNLTFSRSARERYLTVANSIILRKRKRSLVLYPAA